MFFADRLHAEPEDRNVNPTFKEIGASDRLHAEPEDRNAHVNINGNYLCNDRLHAEPEDRNTHTNFLKKLAF